MRVYHFLSADHALDDVAKGRIKISEIDKLNDPFELWCVAQGDRRVRKALRRFKNTMAKQYGMLCFCRRWHNPVLWSHYADNHRGICLGFEADAQYLRAVDYVAERPALRYPTLEEAAEQLLYTKYRDWSYEKELRGWFRLEERDAGHYFYSFDEKIQLREVIAGPLCELPRTTICDALADCRDGVRVVKARLAFETFRVVEDKRGFRR